MLTVEQAARRVGRDAETVRRWVRSGRLRAQKLGGQHFIVPEDLDAITERDTTDLPASLRMREGSRMPDWERLVRDARRSH